MGNTTMNKFVNPYNFIPLGDKKTEYTFPEDKEGLLTGEITYSVLVKTPLFIPKTEKTEEKDQHRECEFFSYGDGRPVIPGSEIRGMFRGNFEILTNSCLSSLESDMQLSKRTGEPFRKGLLKKENEKYYLYEAECLRCKQEEATGLKETQKVWYRRQNSWATDLSARERMGVRYGYLVKGERGGRKKWYHVFCLKENKAPREADLDLLDKVLAEYYKNGKSKYDEYKKALELFKNGTAETYFPVYYSEIESQIYLSPACITREIYHNTLKKCARSYAPCEERKGICPTCALFGMLSGKGESLSSRVRFSDLTSSEYKYGKKVTLRALLTPRLNNMEFYLKRPSKDAIFWTYDYYINKRGMVVFNTPELNGRKFYWHQMNVKESDYTGQKSKLNMTVQPIESGMFSGKMYFSGITGEELKQLVWLLNAGEYGDISAKKHGYKLGAAKPLGFGSVAVNVDEIKLRRVELKEDEIFVVYEAPEDESVIRPNGCFEKGIEDNFRKITAFDAVEGMDVSYPYVHSKDENGYQWFAANHKAFDGSVIRSLPKNRKQMAFLNYLEAMEPVTKETLEGVEQWTGNNNGGRQHNNNQRLHGNKTYAGNNSYHKKPSR